MPMHSILHQQVNQLKYRFFNYLIKTNMKKYTFRLLVIAFIFGATFTSCSTSKIFNGGSSLMSALSGNSNLSTITSLLKTPGLAKLMGPVIKKPFTLLAPSNDAFNALGSGALSSLTKPGNIGQLANLLKNQIVPGKLDAATLLKGGLKTASGTPLNLSGANLGSIINSDKVNIIPIDKILQ